MALPLRRILTSVPPSISKALRLRLMSLEVSKTSNAKETEPSGSLRPSQPLPYLELGASPTLRISSKEAPAVSRET